VKIGIALAGGGAKGAAHLGIIQALEENGIKADIYAGTSAGSIVAAAKAIGYGNKTILKMMDEITNDMIDVNYWGIIKALPFKLSSLESVLKGKELRRFLHRHFDKCISEVKYPLAIISGDLVTGSQAIFSSQEIPVASELDDEIIVYSNPHGVKLSDMVYASAAIPGVFPPFLFKEHKLVDGSVVNILPANALSAMGADKVIAIDLNTQYKPKETKGILNIVARSVNLMIDQNSDLSLRYSDNHMVLTPDMSNISLLQFDKIGEAYNVGYEYGKRIVNQVYDFVYEDA
jgi:NTE family protein